MPTAYSQNLLLRDSAAPERVGDVRHASPLLIVYAGEHVVHLEVTCTLYVFRLFSLVSFRLPVNQRQQHAQGTVKCCVSEGRGGQTKQICESTNQP